MRFKDLLSLSTRGFKTNFSRTALTILGVGVGIGAVVFLVSLGYGLQNVILNKITTADSLLTLDVSSGSNLVELTKESVNKIKEMPEVAEASPVVSLSSQLIHINATTEGLVYLVNKPFFRLSGINFEKGGGFSNENANEIVISSAAAKIFGFDNLQDIIGQSININLFVPNAGKDKDTITVVDLEKDYKIVGVVLDENTNFIYSPINTVGAINLPSYSSLKVKVRSEDILNSVRDEIIKQGFLVSSLSETIDQTKKIFSIVQIVLGAFGLIALIVSAIGMFNTMTITLLERTREIGIMRAIGVGVRDIMKMFLLEAIIMGFLGGITGVSIGYLLGEFFNLLINVLARNFGGQPLSLFYRPTWFILFVLGFSIITGFATGIYPARRAAKINPLEALRYK